nr:FecR family protein [Echinicola shivajiensis]
MNELETPIGGRYQVELPDGTKVWLNAQSKLQFPDQFDERNRSVNLWGEAYFEVEKDSNRPFLVNTYRSDQMDDPIIIKVLGTHFNVMAYPDEKAVNTTLVEGKVQVKHLDQAVILSPGNQALSKNGESPIMVQKANIEVAVGWKNRMFVFEDEPLESIMRKIARWYDVKVEYGSDIRTKKFSGIISQDNEINSVIELLESTEEVAISFESESTLLIK